MKEPRKIVREQRNKCHARRRRYERQRKAKCIYYGQEPTKSSGKLHVEEGAVYRNNAPVGLGTDDIKQVAQQGFLHVDPASEYKGRSKSKIYKKQ